MGVNCKIDRGKKRDRNTSSIAPRERSIVAAPHHTRRNTVERELPHKTTTQIRRLVECNSSHRGLRDRARKGDAPSLFQQRTGHSALLVRFITTFRYYI